MDKWTYKVIMSLHCNCPSSLHICHPEVSANDKAWTRSKIVNWLILLTPGWMSVSTRYCLWTGYHIPWTSWHWWYLWGQRRNSLRVYNWPRAVAGCWVIRDRSPSLLHPCDCLPYHEKKKSKANGHRRVAKRSWCHYRNLHSRGEDEVLHLAIISVIIYKLWVLHHASSHHICVTASSHSSKPNSTK